MPRLPAVLLFVVAAAGFVLLPAAPVGAAQKKKDAPPAPAGAAFAGPFSQAATAALPLPDGTVGTWASHGRVEGGKLVLPAGAAVGTRWVRAATAAGASAPRPVTLDTLPEVAEDPKNRSRDTPQELPGPCVVSGRTDLEARAFFRIPVAKGKPLTLEVLARRLGSPLDPVLVLYHPDGRVVPGAYADDTPGLMGDCRVRYTPPADGAVLAEVRDSTYKGGPDFAYRLRVGDFPGAATAFPLVVRRGVTTAVGFTGPHLRDAGRVPVAAPADGWLDAVAVAPPDGWPVLVRLSDDPQGVESEPNDTPETATRLPVPGGVSARFATPNDKDHFRFPVRKGRKYLVGVLTHELHTPAEVLLRVLDAAGKELGQSNPTEPACKVEFTAAADGDCLAACEHGNGLHGPAEVYHLSVRPVGPDFTLTLPGDRLSLPAGGVGVLVPKLERVNGFAGPVTLAVVGDGLSGQGPAGLPLGVVADDRPGLRALHLKAMATIDGAEVVRWASVAEPVRAALNGIPTVPPELATTVAVAVRPAAAFGLTVTTSGKVTAGAKLLVTVTVRRRAGFDAPVALTLQDPPAGVTAAASVPKGATEATLELTLGDAVSGPVGLVVKGTADGADVLALPLGLEVAKK